MRAEEFYKTKEQLERYELVLEYAAKVLEYQAKNYLIFLGTDLIKGTFGIRTSFHEDSWDVFYYKKEHCTVILVDIEYEDNGRPWIMSKSSIKKQFQKFSFVDPVNIKKIF